MSQIKQTEKAQQLARAIVTNILMLHEDEVDSSVKSDSFYERMADVIDSGRGLYTARVSSDVEGHLYDFAVIDILLCNKRENKSHDIEEL